MLESDYLCIKHLLHCQLHDQNRKGDSQTSKTTACIPHLYSGVENWASSNGPPFKSFFLGSHPSPDTEAEWLHVYLPYSWFGSVHWSTIRQIWQWICLSQGLLWKHLKINRDVVKGRTFISGFFIPFIMSFGQRIPHQWQRNRTQIIFIDDLMMESFSHLHLSKG